jgi:hypothetical protein
MVLVISLPELVLDQVIRSWLAFVLGFLGFTLMLMLWLLLGLLGLLVFTRVAALAPGARVRLSHEGLLAQLALVVGCVISWRIIDGGVITYILDRVTWRLCYLRTGSVAAAPPLFFGGLRPIFRLVLLIQGGSLWVSWEWRSEKLIQGGWRIHWQGSVLWLELIGGGLWLLIWDGDRLECWLGLRLGGGIGLAVVLTWLLPFAWLWCHRWSVHLIRLSLLSNIANELLARLSLLLFHMAMVVR